MNKPLEKPILVVEQPDSSNEPRKVAVLDDCDYEENTDQYGMCTYDIVDEYDKWKFEQQGISFNGVDYERIYMGGTEEYSN